MTDRRIEILLVEDNPGDARLIREMLAEGSQNHYGLECADRLGNALQVLTDGKEVDLVLLDLGLPDSNGLETLNRVYEQKREIPIVVLTGLEDEALGAEAVRNGAQDYLCKSDMRAKELWRVIRYAMERKRAEAAIRLVESRLQHLVTRSPAIIFALRIQNGSPEFTFISNNIKEQLDYTPAEFIGNYEFWKQCIHPDDLAEVTSSLPRLLEEGTAIYEYRFRQKDGTYKWLRDDRRVFYDAEGRPTEIVGSWLDITDRKNAEQQLKSSLEEKEMLLKEIHHRVKNNMQVISSLLRLQERYIDNEEYVQMFRESQNRIQSMSLVHQKLYQSSNLATIDFGGFIRSLANILLRSYGVDMNNVSINIDSGDVWLGIDTAIPCGLIINELVSNSLKYAFPHGRKGEIRIGLHSRGEGEVELTASDNGVGIPQEIDFQNTDSLGLQLVTTLVRQLHGEIELDRTQGTNFRITFKAESQERRKENVTC